MEVPLRTSPLAFVREIVILMRIVSLGSCVNNAQGLKLSPDVLVFLNPVKTTADLLIRPHCPLLCPPMQ
jgi:hypothetical protein